MLLQRHAQTTCFVGIQRQVVTSNHGRIDTFYVKFMQVETFYA